MQTTTEMYSQTLIAGPRQGVSAPSVAAKQAITSPKAPKLTATKRIAPQNAAIAAAGNVVSPHPDRKQRQLRVSTAAVAGGRQASKYCMKEPVPENGTDLAKKKAETNVVVFSAGTTDQQQPDVSMAIVCHLKSPQVCALHDQTV